MFLDYRQPVKMQWRIVWLNVAAACVNLGFTAWNISNGKWMFLANLISAGVSIWVARWSWQKIPEIKAREQRKIVDILSGKFG